MNLLFRSNNIGMNLKSTPAPAKLGNRAQNGRMCVYMYAGLCSGMSVSFFGVFFIPITGLGGL
jgi:hypothetical protein